MFWGFDFSGFGRGGFLGVLFSVWFGYDSFLGFGGWLWVSVVAAKKKGT